MCIAWSCSITYPKLVHTDPPSPHLDPLSEQCLHSFYVGEEALAKRGTLSLRYPLEHGIVNDWDKMEKIWHYTFNKVLKVDTTKQPLLMSECPISIRAFGHRAKMTQIMFESFAVPSLYLANQAALSLYASGCDTGVVLDIGADIAYAVPIYAGHALPYATQYRAYIAGKQLTHHLFKMLLEKGHSLSTSFDRDVSVRDIKEKLCYVAYDYEQELQITSSSSSSSSTSSSSATERSYKLPDGQVVTAGTEMFRCPEALFQPRLMGEVNLIRARLRAFACLCYSIDFHLQ